MSFAPSPQFAAAIQIIPAPGYRPGELASPGDVAVIVAADAGTLDVFVHPRYAGGPTDSNLALERLGPKGVAVASPAAVAPPATMAVPVQRSSPPLPASPAGAGMRGSVQPAVSAPALARLLLHVSRRGDVVGQPGEWVAGPAAPAPIEGLQIDLAPSSPFRLEYQVLLAGFSEGWSAWMPAGTFAGTRGRARPLNGVRFRLASSGPDRYEIDAEALYLGASIDRKTGVELEFVAPSPRDALVGLRFALTRAQPEFAVAAMAPVAAGFAGSAPSGASSFAGGVNASSSPAFAAAQNPPAASNSDGGRIKVFRAAGVR
ncbi:hypothetical protein [Chelatococcus reniformis]|uniref:hypothetical protein n=1 Tax=Chelatococcus reniformis TaxID=1494448 RepID=UPI00166A4985|nr:hypothetical protein [Chelatococcus reniformis]